MTAHYYYYYYYISGLTSICSSRGVTDARGATLQVRDICTRVYTAVV